MLTAWLGIDTFRSMSQVAGGLGIVGRKLARMKSSGLVALLATVLRDCLQGVINMLGRIHLLIDPDEGAVVKEEARSKWSRVGTGHLEEVTH